jgi:uncharacterized protein YndB with AHSA1/START domain
MAPRRTDRASRRIAASASRVWRAMTDPAELVCWLPPAGMSGRFDRFDLRPGGGYRLTLTYADATGGHGKTTADSDTVEAGFVDIVPGRLLVQSVVFEADDPAYAGKMLMEWALESDGAGTLVTITARNVPPGISAADHDEGLRSSLQNLAAFVE